MAASMVGSALVGLLIKRYRVESYMRGVFVVSAATMVVPLLYHTELHSHEGQEGGCRSLGGPGGHACAGGGGAGQRAAMTGMEKEAGGC
jgi:hypothetical protein